MRSTGTAGRQSWGLLPVDPKPHGERRRPTYRVLPTRPGVPPRPLAPPDVPGPRPEGSATAAGPGADPGGGRSPAVRQSTLPGSAAVPWEKRRGESAGAAARTARSHCGRGPSTAPSPPEKSRHENTPSSDGPGPPHIPRGMACRPQHRNIPLPRTDLPGSGITSQARQGRSRRRGSGSEAPARRSPAVLLRVRTPEQRPPYQPGQWPGASLRPELDTLQKTRGAAPAPAFRRSAALWKSRRPSASREAPGLPPPRRNRPSSPPESKTPPVPAGAAPG